MIKLLKLYCIDYTKKLFITYFIALLVGVFFFSPIANNLTERLVFANYSLYIALYGVFFYHFPLRKMAKWIVNFPITKSKLIVFNIIFQIFKIILTVTLLLATISLEFKLFEKNLYVDQLNNKMLVLNETFVQGHAPVFNSSFLGSTYLLTIFIGLTFLFTFIFNVAPYGIFQQQVFSWARIKETTFYLWKEKRWVIYAFILFFLTSPIIFNYRPLVATSFFIFMFLMMLATYDKVLIFPQHLLLKSTSLICFIGIVIGGLFYIRSVEQITRGDITTAEKMSELNFLGENIFTANSSGEKFVSILKANPSWADLEIIELIKLFKKSGNFPSKVLKTKMDVSNLLFSDNRYSYLTLLPLLREDNIDKKIILNFLEKLDENHPPENLSSLNETIRRLPSFFFIKEDINDLLESKSLHAQFVGLSLLDELPPKQALNLLSDAKKVVHPMLSGAVESIGHQIRCNYSKSNKIEKISYCRRHRKISSILSSEYR